MSVGCVMNEIVAVFRARFALRLALVGAAAGLLAGCSSSERLSDPLSNPFQSSARVDGQASAGGALGAPVASANPSQQNLRAASVVPPPDLGHAAGWSAQGGSPIVVAQGENAQMLSHRYGVPVDALIRTNGLSVASQIQPGTRLIIPVYNANLAASSGVHTAPKLAQAKATAQPKALGAPPRTLAAQAHKETQSPLMSVRGQKTASAAGDASATAKQAAVQPAKSEAFGEAKGPGRSEGPAAATVPVSSGALVSEAANPEFRWPARGRIIQAFKPGGNDGINIALPEGTSVKAAESGVVAYAGNELKGYGNLILIRHPNGFVSAYANTSEIDVKRGDTVKRGQTIAKSGQSGNVSTPQLHFELRKGTTPVDPTQYLAGV